MAHGSGLGVRFARAGDRCWSSRLLVAIVGGAVMGGVAGARRAGTAVDRFVDDWGSASVTIFTGEPLDSTLRAELEDDERITALMDVVVVAVSPTSLPEWGGVTLLVPGTGWGDLIRPRLIDGRFPTGPNEIVMSERTMDRGFDVGDTIELTMLESDEIGGCFGEGVCIEADVGMATITGAVRMPTDLAPGPFDDGVFLAADDFGDAERDAFILGHITDVHTTRDSDPFSILDDYSAQVDNGEMSIGADDVASAVRATDLQHGGLLIASAVVAVAGMLIVGQAFVRFLTRRTSETLKLCALGMTREQRCLAASIPGLCGAALGALGAIPIALFLSPVFPQGIARRGIPTSGSMPTGQSWSVERRSRSASGRCAPS